MWACFQALGGEAYYDAIRDKFCAAVELDGGKPLRAFGNTIHDAVDNLYLSICQLTAEDFRRSLL